MSKGFLICHFALIASLGASALMGCARKIVTERHEGMRPVTTPPEVVLSGGSQLREKLLETAKYLERREKYKEKLSFGSCQVETSTYRNFLLNLPEEKTKLESYLRDEAQWFEVYGKEEWSEILLTSYFSPLYKARRKPSGEFTQPIYRIPADLIEVALSSFSRDDLAQLKTDRSVVSARLVPGPGAIKRVVPYFSRAEIDQEKKLKGLGLEIAYLKPVDAFFLQIQGSGQLQFKDGEKISVGYAAQNGFRYHSIGKYLYQNGIMEKDAISMASIEDYLAKLNEKELYEFLAHNPSYVFFKELDGGFGVTTSGLEVEPMATLAVDTSFFELGSVAILEYQHPQFSGPKEAEPHGFEQKMRIVLAHDTGGAIKGPGRADLYWGAGPVAQQAAGVMKHPARLWFVAPKGSCHD